MNNCRLIGYSIHGRRNFQLATLPTGEVLKEDWRHAKKRERKIKRDKERDIERVTDRQTDRQIWLSYGKEGRREEIEDTKRKTIYAQKRRRDVKKYK